LAPSWPSIFHPYFASFTIVTLFLLFAHSWRQTDVLLLFIVTPIIPLLIYGMMINQAWMGSISGSLGILCFLLDRLGKMRSHPFWHIFGGLCVMFSVMSGIEHSTI